MRWISSMNSTSRRRKVGHDADEIARLLDHRTRGRPDRHAHLVGDHVGERGLAKTRRPVQQHVVERFAALPGGGNRHLQVLADAVLSDVFVERARPQPASYCASSSARTAVMTRVGQSRLVRSFISPDFPRSACFKCSLEARVGRRLERRLHRFLGKRPMIAQVHQRREQIVAQAVPAPPHRLPPRPPAREIRGSRSFSSSTMRSDVFLPTPGIPVKRATSPRSIA